MPKIFEYFGFIFLFYSNEHEPISEKDSATAEAFVNKYNNNIVDKWVNFFVYKKRIRSTKITKKL